MWFSATGLVACLVALAIGSLAQAQEDGLQTLIDAAQAEGMRIIVIDPQAEPADAAPVPEQSQHPLAGVVGHAVKQFNEIKANLADPDWPQPSSNPTKPMTNGIGTVFGLAIGLLLARWLGLMLAPRFKAQPPGASRPERVVLAIAGAGLAAVISMALPFAIYGGGSKTIELIGNIMNGFLVSSLVLITVGAVLERMVERPEPPISGVEGARFFAAIRWLAIGLFSFVSGAYTLAFMYPDPNFEDLMRVIYITFSALLLIGVLFPVRRVCASIVAEALHAEDNWIVRNTWPLILGYAGFAWAIGIVRQLNGDIEAVQIVVAPVVGLVMGAAAYHIALFALSKTLKNGTVVHLPEGEDPERHSPRHWTERSALAVAILVGALFALDRAGIALIEATGRLNGVSEIALILLIAFVFWTFISTTIDERIVAERGPAGEAGEGDGEGGVGESRLATLLPLVRSAIFVFLAFVVGLILLYEAGVNITPIFASAGIIGLAIGFGAQSLVKDVISGLFFLLDDAFRKGEYIETNGLRGTVESISVRSMQLRHHNGPLNTIPFGAIQDLTNFSRDWVIMKLKLQVTLDTDVERLRKLVKKLGVELLDDPQVGHKFIEPLKSQGVLNIDTWGMTIRVKFKTTPGEQFIIRRVVYTKIHEMFEREGIKFATRDVKVRVGGVGDMPDDAPEAAGTPLATKETTPQQTPSAAKPTSAEEARRIAAAGGAAMLMDDDVMPSGGDER